MAMMVPPAPQQAEETICNAQNALCCFQLEDAPLLNLEAEPDWPTVFPVWSLPPLPPRSAKYYMQPWLGISLVVVICSVLLGLGTMAANSSPPVGQVATLSWFLVYSGWLQSGIAAFCVAYLLFGNKGEIERRHHTCYPIPDSAAQSLLYGSPGHLKRNVDGINGNSYCVRCLVWRPGHINDGGPGHHCNTCQRCVVGFDHHCGVFGRCITSANMPCFYVMIAMLFTGIATTGLCLALNSSAMSIFSPATPSYSGYRPVLPHVT